MKKAILITIFLIPLTTHALWWNPFTWKVFNKEEVKVEKVVNTPLPAATTTEKVVPVVKKTVPVQKPVTSTAPKPVEEPKKQITVQDEQSIYPSQVIQWQPVKVEPIQEVKQVVENKSNKNEILDLILKDYDKQIEESKRRTEEGLKQLEMEHQEREALDKKRKEALAPLQEKLNSVEIKQKELGCGGTTMDYVIGSKAQQCREYNAEKGDILSEMQIVMAKHMPKVVSPRSAPRSDFTGRSSIMGSHYQIYYDGVGGGSIYNISNPGESYQVMFSYGMCNIY